MTALRLVQWNAEGIRPKKTELQAFPRDKNIDVVCTQESHLREDHRFFIRGFEAFRRDRPTGHKGGVITLVRNGIPAVQTNQTADEDLMFITIKLLFQQKELLITNCYSPPISRLQLHSVALQRENHTTVGDFNGHSSS